MTSRSWLEKHGPSWRVRVRDKRKKRTVRSGLTYKIACRIKKETDLKIKNGKKIVTAHVTVEQLIEKINEILRPQVSSEYCDLIVRSMRELAEHTGPRLSQIDFEGIDTMKADLLDQGCVEATVNKYIRHCSEGCKKAVEWEMLTDNPFDRVSKLTEPEREIRIITKPEESQLLNACNSLRDRCIIYLGIDGGLRAKEIANLKLKEDFDCEQGRTKIINRDNVNTKTKKQRSIYIFDNDRKSEITLLSRCRKGYGLFPFYNRNAYCVSQRMIQIRNRAGLDCSLHDLRRTCATRMLLSGVPVPVVAKWLGHTIKVMQEFYAYICTEDLMQVKQRMYDVQGAEHKNTEKNTLKGLMAETDTIGKQG